jgi:hypothetical protein
VWSFAGPPIEGGAAHDDAQRTFRAVHPEGRNLLSNGELVELVGESESGLQQSAQRTRECGADGDLAGALRELLG